ncbi:MAG: hypothetical protein ACLRXA_22965 [Clostridium sp.]
MKKSVPWAQGKGPQEAFPVNKYLRYMGELEIARVDLPAEERVTVIGQWILHIKYLPFIRQRLGNKAGLETTQGPAELLHITRHLHNCYAKCLVYL